MKALVLQTAHFRLPDDFQGTVSDALKLLVEYHDQMTGTPNQDLRVLEVDIGEMSFRKANTVLFDRFIDAVKDGHRFVGTVQLVSYNTGYSDVIF